MGNNRIGMDDLMREIEDMSAGIHNMQEERAALMAELLPLAARLNIDDLLIRERGARALMDKDGNIRNVVANESARVIDRSIVFDEATQKPLIRYEIRKINKDGSLHGIVSKIDENDMAGWELSSDGKK